MMKLNFDFLKNYGQLQSDIMFSRFINLQYAVIHYSQCDSFEFWNYALTDQLLSNQQLINIEQAFSNLGRKATIYFENCPPLISQESFLVDSGYQFNFADSWMFHSGVNIDSSKFDQVRKVENERDLEIFLQTFDSCYQKDDPQNNYGELGGYIDIARTVWRQHHDGNRLEYFIVYSQNQPVAVSSLTNYEKLGYISNVGSLPAVRGQGFGKLATLFCVLKSQKNGNNFHFLATEEGTFAHTFYQKIGFNSKFIAKAFTKE